MNKKIKIEAMNHLSDVVLTLKIPDEYYESFKDVYTINELLSLFQRYEAARMSWRGKTHLGIAEETSASIATVSRVNRSLNYGSDGYDMVLVRLTGGTQAGKGDIES